MNKHYESHVESLLKGFLEMLSPQVRESLTPEHLGELEILIESAISTAVLQELEVVADEVYGVAAVIRRRAERFDSAATA